MKKFFIFLILAILILPVCVSSVWEWDNILAGYDEKTRTATIENAFGFGDVIAEVRLISPNSVWTEPGKNRQVAEFEINNMDSYDNIFNKLEFFSKGTMKKQGGREFIYKYKEIIGQEEIEDYDFICAPDSSNHTEGAVKCSYQKIGSHFEDTFIWHNLDTREVLSAGKVTIAIFTDVLEGETTEWIPTLYGVEIDKWADFSGYTRYEYHIVGDTEAQPTDAPWILGQTFTIGNVGTDESFVVQGISIKGYEEDNGQDYMMNIMIFEVDGSNFPINNPIAYNYSVDIGLFPAGAGAIDWVNLTFDKTGTLSASTKYALVINSTSPDGTDRFRWADDPSTAIYGGGTLFYNNSAPGCPAGILAGGTACDWNVENTWDFLFEIYGSVTDITPPNITILHPIESNYSQTWMDFNASVIENNITELCWYTMDTGTTNISLSNSTTNATRFIHTNTSLADGIYIANFYCNDTQSNLNDTESIEFQIETTAPTLSLLSNLTDYSNSDYHTFSTWNYTAADDNYLDACYYNTTQNTTVTIVTCNMAEEITVWEQVGEYTVQYCANDSAANEVCSTKDINIYYFNYTQEVDKEVIGQGDLAIFNLTVNMTNIPVVDALFVYNYTGYTPTTSASASDEYNFTSSFTIPDVFGDAAGENVSWFWVFNISDRKNVTTKNETQVVYAMDVDDCSTLGLMILNFTLRDEANDSLMDLATAGRNSTIDVDVTLTSGDSIWEHNLTWSNLTNGSICIPSGILDDESSEYRLDLVTHYVTDDYVEEFYYLDNFTISNATVAQPRDVFLRELLSADSTSFLVSYEDDGGALVEGVIISLLRYYVGDGEFREVEAGKTNYAGETILHLVEEDVIYIFNVTLEGSVVYTSGESRHYCTAGETCRVRLFAGIDMGDFPEDYDRLPEGTWAVTGDQSKRIVTLAFSLNQSELMNLTVYKYSNNISEMSTIIGQNTTTASIGSLTIYVPYSYGNATYYAVVYRGDDFVGSRWVDLKEKLSDYVGAGTTTFLTALMILALGLMAISHGVGGVVLFTSFGLIIASILGLLNAGFYLLMYIISAGLIILIKSASSQRAK